MPSFVINEKCDGCKGGDVTACLYICPNDLMVLDEDRMKAYNCEPDMCWECYNCVKGPLSSGAVRSNGSNFPSEPFRKGRRHPTGALVLDPVLWMMKFCLRNRLP